ncbi:MAG: exodeoxyribonuclease V subunit alpha [Gammaproteobacteria bacterium]|nr:MAG: exodeoxyribonuclease V subunit alpha [Gammaproteobacteria bacterium]
MNGPLPSENATLPALARHFARFCRQLDGAADTLALATAAVLAARNLEGDTCLDLRRLSGQPLLRDEEGQSLLDAPALETWLDTLPCGFIGAGESNRPLVLDGPRLYLRRHWQEEVQIARALLARTGPVEYDPQWLKERLQALFPEKPGDEGKGAAGQRLAAAMALTRRLAIITGGPGTGKTTTVTRILALLLEQEPDLRIMLAAPTGKAAARLRESIEAQTSKLGEQVNAAVLEQMPREAATLHRLLGWGRDGFAWHADNPLPCDCLLIDETSMVDQGLMAATLAALPAQARLILLGDRNQLSSVEAGSVLGDLTGQGETPALDPARAAELEALTNHAATRPVTADAPPLHNCVAELSYSYRFASGGGIGRLAEAVNAGDANKASAILREADAELDWIDAEGEEPPQAVIRQALEWYSPVFEADDPAEALRRFNRARILTARADGPWGEAALRERLETALRQQRSIRTLPGQPYRGQPIIILRNDRETGLFNGDTGILWPDPEAAAEGVPQLRAWFESENGLRAYALHQLPAWQTAWTLTVHRSQGSEYDRVLLVLPAHESRVLTRELVYTGITRARRLCCIAGSMSQLLEACRRRTVRNSGLGERLLVSTEAKG